MTLPPPHEKIVQYQVFSYDDVITLNHSIDSSLALGWKLYRNLQITTNDNKLFYSQAMVRYE